MSQARSRRIVPLRARRRTEASSPPSPPGPSIDPTWVQTNAAIFAKVWVARQEATDDRIKMVYCLGRVQGYYDVVKNLDLLNENGFGGFIGHLRRMQAESFADGDHEAHPLRKSQLFGMSDAWGDLAERSETAVKEWMTERQRHA